MHYSICAVYMPIFYRAFFLFCFFLFLLFFFFFSFFVSTLAAVSYFNKLTAKTVAERVTQEKSVTMATFHFPNR